MSIEKILYTATATATGGREGQATSSDGVLDVKLSTPRELGGAGGDGTNPEQLFAAGYSACFLGALKFVAGKQRVALPATTTVTGKVGIGKVVLRDREDLVAVFPHDDGLVLQKLHYPHELRKMEDVPDLESVGKLDAQKLNKNELKLATTLVQEMTTSLSEIDTEDNYHNALRTLIDSKIKGRQVTEFEEVEEVPRLDIMSALKKSLQASSRKPMVKAPATADKKKPQITLVKPRAAKKRKVG